MRRFHPDLRYGTSYDRKKANYKHMKFTEEKLEQVFTELLSQQVIPHLHGSTIKRSPDEVLIEEDLMLFA